LPIRKAAPLEPTGTAVKLSITHTIEREPSKFIVAVSGGWPKIILQPEVTVGNRLRRSAGPYSPGNQR
jgi:hypothetical protein